MASLLEMRFASEGEEEDTDYVESSSSEQGSQTDSSSSSDDEAAAEQQRLHLRAYRSRPTTTRRAEDTAAAGAAVSHGDAAAVPFPSGRLADAARAPAASARAETAAEEAAKAAGEGDSPLAAVPSATAATTETNSTVEAGESGEQGGGDMQLHGRKKIFSARQRPGTDRKHTRTRDQASRPHKKRHIERLRASEVFKEMQQAETEALQSYPSMVDPDDFILQFHRRCPPENSAHTRSWQHLQHHLSIAVSALQRPSGAAAASLSPLQPLASSSSSSSHGGGAHSAASSSSAVGACAAAAALSPEGSAVAATTVARDPLAASAVSSLSQNQQQFDVVSLQHQPPQRAASFSSSAQRLCVAAGDTTAGPSTAIKQQTPGGQTASAETASLDPTGAPAGHDADRRETITPSKPMDEGRNSILLLRAAASAAATRSDVNGAAATGTAVTGDVTPHTAATGAAATGIGAADAADTGAADTGAAVTDATATDATATDPAATDAAATGAAVVDAAADAAAVQNVQANACVAACGQDVSVARDASDVAAGAVSTRTAALSATQESSCSAPATVSGFSIRECKERCRKKLSNASLVKMMQDALHSMENAGEVSVKKVVRFAGQIVEVEERMEAASAKYQHMRELQRRTPQHIGGRFAVLDGLVAALDGPSSINSVQKSQADWEGYKREKGLAAELAKGHGFLQKQAFLAQAEWKQHEQNVELRRRRQAERR